MRGGENGGALRSGELGFGEKPSHFLYGRDTELGVVVDLVEDVRNRGGVLLVRSEPGIGKSTLLAAAARTSGVVRVTAPKVILGQAGKPASMDYQVFLVTRIYEEWHRRGDNRAAVTHGLAATGRTITAAGAIMVLVFGAFILGGERVIELFGLGLAGAVLLDALVVRSVLVPGLMLLAGKANWWLPRGLDRLLPHLNVEGSVDQDDLDERPPRPVLVDQAA
jgi:MMPL family